MLGVKANAISRRKVLSEPVLEKYTFVPNDASFPLRESVRIMSQIILENNYNIRFKGLELQTANQDLISPLISEALADLPLIKPEFVVLQETDKLGNERELDVIVGTNLLQKPSFATLQDALKAKAFVLSRELVDFKQQNYENIERLITHKISETENLVLFRPFLQKSELQERPIHITDDHTKFEWLDELRTTLSQSENVLLYSQNETSGIMGLTNCLRMEAGGNNVRCVFTMDEAPPFHPEDPFYRNQLRKGLAVNVFKDGQWGTFRHLLIQKEILVEREHSFANATVRGDLSSLKWIEGPLNSKKQRAMNFYEKLVQVHYASLNFRDIMLATGRISADSISTTAQYGFLGLEFAGVDVNGRRVMGIMPSGALSSLVLADPFLLLPVPEHWTLEDAATVPVVYGTVIYAFFMVGTSHFQTPPLVVYFHREATSSEVKQS